MDLPLMDWTIYDNAISDWLVALGLSALIVLTVYLLKPIAIRRLQAMSGRTRTGIDDAVVAALQATKLWLVVIFAASIGAQSLELSDRAGAALKAATTVAFFVQLGFWLGSLLKFWLQRSQQRALAVNAAAATSLAALGFLAQVAMWSILLLVALDNLGINVTALVAGLGVGGVAVALAVQNILGDLFASLSIVIDKPFVIGDFIIVDEYMGSVEHIGLKTTRIRSLDGELIVFSNSDLLKARVRNYKRMTERRCVFTFRLPYDSPPEALERVPEAVKGLIEKRPKTRFERAHFQKFGEWSLDFEVVYWMTDPDYNLFMDTQQAINLDLMRELERLDVGFALPTRMVKAAVQASPAADDGDGLGAQPREPRKEPRAEKAN